MQQKICIPFKSNSVLIQQPESELGKNLELRTSPSHFLATRILVSPLSLSAYTNASLETKNFHEFSSVVDT